MKLRVFLASAIVSLWAGCQCGPASLCEAVKCGGGLVCAPATGKCAVPGTSQGGSDGGSGAGTGGGTGGGTAQPGDAGPQCPMTCGGAAPVCDPVAQKCVVCTATAGCSAPTGVCDTKVAPAGACVGCRTFVDCEGESMDCDTATHTCYKFDAGFGGGHGAPVQFDDAGLSDHCKDVTGSAPTCRGESCPKGYACANGACVLNGRNGPVQVTLRWDRDEDLDLYVVAPKVNGGGPCEVYYSQPNAPPVTIGGITFPTVGCGAQVYLDRDSNPACKLDHVDVENVVTPTGAVALSGKYTVRANYYENCSATSPVPYEIEVRANGQTRFYCGKFAPNAANGGNGGAGIVITEFTIQ